MTRDCGIFAGQVLEALVKREILKPDFPEEGSL
jgi:hypothetical protein